MLGAESRVSLDVDLVARGDSFTRSLFSWGQAFSRIAMTFPESDVSPSSPHETLRLLGLTISGDKRGPSIYPGAKGGRGNSKLRIRILGKSGSKLILRGL